jgi:hypothetical protein
MRITMDRPTQTPQLFSHGTTISSLKQGKIRPLIHTHIHSKAITVFPSPHFGEAPDLQNSSWTFLGVDWTPFHLVGQDLNEGWLSLRGWPSPDEISRQVGPILFGVQLEQDYSEDWSSGAKEDLEYCHAAHYLLWSHVLPYSSSAQPLAGGSRGQNGWNLTGASRNITELLFNEKPSNTQRSKRTQTLFDASSPRWAHTQNSNPRTVKLQYSYRAVQGIRLWWVCWLLIGGLALGVADRDCLGRSSRDLCWQVYL